MRINIGNVASTHTTANAGRLWSASELIEGLLKAQRAMRGIEEVALPSESGQMLDPAWGGMRVISSPYLPSPITEPVRQHKRRRWMSAAYHARVQKKWTKRWGTHEVHVAYMIGGNVLGMSPEMLDKLGHMKKVAAVKWTKP